MEYNIKRIPVSPKHQITIPLEYYNALGISNEVQCILKGNAIILQPVKDDGSAFADLILQDLIAEGYTGSELLEEFRQRCKQIRPAVEKMLDKGRKIAEGRGEYYTMEDVFGEDTE